LQAAPEFEAWLDRMDMKDRAGRIRPFQPQAPRFLMLPDPDPFHAG
jgi:ethanolamine ammonia-lyase large subunit